MSSRMSSLPLPSLNSPSIISSILTTIPSSSSSPPPSPGTQLTPHAYLARMRAGQTSFDHEIWDAAHRLYLYLTLSSCSQTRASCFRRLVRLCIAHHDLLLGPVLASTSGSASPTPLTACPTCRTSCTASSRCCWYRPDTREMSFLALVVSLCKNNAALFGDDVTPAQFRASFQWE